MLPPPVLIALLLVSISTSGAAADNVLPSNNDLLTFIRALEAPHGYDDYERRIRTPPPQPLTQMTVAAVLAWQQQLRQRRVVSTAAGGYQIIYPTLSRLVRQYGIDPKRKFDPDLQDQLARLLIAECGPRPSARHTQAHPRFGNCLASIWASLPRTAGPRQGYSAYHGIAGNKALTTPSVVLAVLAGEKIAPPRLRASRRTATVTNRSRPNQRLAFGAVRIADANAAMRRSARQDQLTPSVHKWAFDPYSSD